MLPSPLDRDREEIQLSEPKLGRFKSGDKGAVWLALVAFLLEPPGRPSETASPGTDGLEACLPSPNKVLSLNGMFASTELGSPLASGEQPSCCASWEA